MGPYKIQGPGMYWLTVNTFWQEAPSSHLSIKIIHREHTVNQPLRIKIFPTNENNIINTSIKISLHFC